MSSPFIHSSIFLCSALIQKLFVSRRRMALSIGSQGAEPPACPPPSVKGMGFCSAGDSSSSAGGHAGGVTLCE